MPKIFIKKYKTHVEKICALANKGSRWLIVISADPDAIASALALKRILSRRAQEVNIARINEITRPDNLSMLRYLRVDLPLLTPEIVAQHDHFAMVDSQPEHHAEFAGIPFSIVIDHHPPCACNLTPDAVLDIRPEYGSCSAILCTYLVGAKIRPGRMLATALLYGIYTDTGNFSRKTSDADLRAVRFLTTLADHAKLSRIYRGQFLMDWITPFVAGVQHMQKIGSGQFIYMGNVQSPDLLVLTVDFLMHIHEVRFAAVAGVYKNSLVITLRSDGVRNVGTLATQAFGAYGSAGGHQSMARAEIPLENIKDSDPEEFVLKRVHAAIRRKKAAK